MRPARTLTVALVLAALGAAALADAATLRVEIEGLDDARLRDNVNTFLQIRRLADRPEPDAARIAWAHAQASGEIRTALEPFGYYAPEVEASLEREGETWIARYRIRPGEPVRIAAVEVRVDGEARTDPAFAELLARDPLAPGQVLEHARYEDFKRALQGLATERGYFDAKLETAEIRVDAPAHRADIVLHLDAGARYRFGSVSFAQDPRILRDDVLARYNRIQPGQPYLAADLLDLQTALGDSDYFDTIAVDASPARAEHRDIPVEVALTPRKRKRYTYGLGYGTDTGVRGRAAFEDRYVNDSGHKLTTDLRLSTIKSTLSAEYKLPGEDPRNDEIALRAGEARERSTAKDSDTALIGVTRRLQDGPWQRLLSLDYQAERFRNDEGGRTTTKLLIPGGNWTRTVTGGDPLEVSSGYRLSLGLRGAAEPLLSDLSFVQASAGLKWIVPLSAAGRLLARADLGTTFASDFERLPSSLRFYAGGDNSVRGYGYQVIGPRNAEDKVVGGKRLAVASLEYEHRVYDRWGLAAFVDAGDAFDDSPSIKLGAGLGLRWASPVGPIRLDFAHGFDEPGDPLRIHFTLGPDL